ncbi:hypothetical protein C4A39_03570 [Escherichia coli]|nr:hypothetical protein C4A39_03570 [Escherichia coli]RDQ65324.1 hypothetical protein C4A28_03245 [Escherichia coli]
MPGTTTAVSINFIGIAARTMNSNGSHGKPQIPVDYQKLLSIEGITEYPPDMLQSEITDDKQM